MDLDIVGDNMCVDEEIKAARPKMQKTVKPSLKDAVHAARLKLMRGDNNHVTKAHVTDRKGKSLPAASYVDLLPPCCYLLNQHSSSLT
jgi:hypothetical protein